jgi:hypothetical protein
VSFLPVRVFSSDRPPKGVKTVRLAAGFNDDFSPVQELVGPDTNGFFTVTVTIPVGYYKYKIVHDRQKYRHDPGNWREFGFLHDSLLTVGSPMGPPPRKPTRFLVPSLEATLGTRSMPAALTRTGHNITLVRGSSPGT